MNQKQSTWLEAFKVILSLVAVIWLVEVVNSLLDHRLNVYGIYPRNVNNLVGIILWPFLHGNFNHLIMNSMPLLAMGYFVALRGWLIFLSSSAIILIVGGLGVWLFGREAYHVGASGLVFGFFGFLITLAFYERSLKTFAIACLTVFYYGGIIFGILPTNSFVSWEGHLFGLVAGMFAARVLAVTRNTT
ncbi:MAG: membrane associated rhomboid family serine protease [Candidatus Azotimanducaceae bacterium]